MRGMQKFLLSIFSLIIILIAAFVIAMVANIVDFNVVVNKISSLIFYDKTITICVGAVVLLFALIGLFSGDSSYSEGSAGLAIKSEKGTVYITKDTFESIIISVAKNYPELKNVRAEISISEKGVIANIYAMILPDTIVPTLTAKLQESIKSSVLSQTTVEIKEANVKIKGVYIEQNKK